MIKITTLGLTIGLALCLTNCQNTPSDKKKLQLSEPEVEVKTIPTTTTNVMSLGFQLVERNCFSCHSPNAEAQQIIAPNMASVKKQYLEKYPNEAEFSQALFAFVTKPEVEKSLMKDAVQKFGLMPKMSFEEEHVKAIAQYIYRTPIQEKTWFAQQYETEKQLHESKTEALSPEAQGLQWAMQTKAVLGKNLMQALQKYKAEGAVDFCHTRAIPLTDSMATKLQANIRRVSDNYRNPTNKANKEQLTYLQQARQNIAEGKKPKPQLLDKGTKWIALYPITIDKMCLQCHGSPQKDIAPATLAVIQQRYPQDKAVGYRLNDLRGAWVVEMSKK